MPLRPAPGRRRRRRASSAPSAAAPRTQTVDRRRRSRQSRQATDAGGAAIRAAKKPLLRENVSRQAEDRPAYEAPAPALQRGDAGRSRRRWDVTPLQKICDRDAAHAAAVERRRREAQAQAREHFHRAPHGASEDFATAFVEDSGALDAARARLRSEREYAAPEAFFARAVDEVEDDGPPPPPRAHRSARFDADDARAASPVERRRPASPAARPSVRSSLTSPRSSYDAGPASPQRRASFADGGGGLRSDADCVGSPRRGRPSARGGRTTTRATSPFDEAVARRVLAQHGDAGRRARDAGRADAAAADLFDASRLDAFGADAARAYGGFASANAAHGPPAEPTLRAAAGLAAAAAESAAAARDVQRAHLGAMADVGAMARAVGGLVSSAAATMDLHEKAQQRHTQHEASAGGFHAWQAQAQKQLDASLRMQHQQMAATLADWRAAAGAPPAPPQIHRGPLPGGASYGGAGYGAAGYGVAGYGAAGAPPGTGAGPRPPGAHAPRFGGDGAEEPRRVPPPAPAQPPRSGAAARPSGIFATDPRTRVPTAVPPVPRGNGELLEMLWDKIGEIEADEWSISHRLDAWRRGETLQAAPKRPEDDGRPVSLPLGVVEGLFAAQQSIFESQQQAGGDEAPARRTTLTPNRRSCEGYVSFSLDEAPAVEESNHGRTEQRRVSGVPPPFAGLKTDANVGGQLAQRITLHRDTAGPQRPSCALWPRLIFAAQVWRHRDLAEAELFNTGLNQAQIIEVLAEDALLRLVQEAAAELDAALRDCSDAILTRV
ncbi:hypothetical protein M885DRAFT_626191 [Pelagophyceae sp. CCMP2097]|nr:hypothetical protein M885DRAFT_626191 [Pelagophyceae sp. CCMP2097]